MAAFKSISGISSPRSEAQKPTRQKVAGNMTFCCASLSDPAAPKSLSSSSKILKQLYRNGFILYRFVALHYPRLR